MTATPLLAMLTTAFREAAIPYMLTGSVASAWYGAGRATLDIDFVIDPTASQIEALLRSLHRPGIYVSAEAAREALANESMFNVIDIDTGWKADLIIRRARPFSRAEFERRVAVTFEDQQLFVPRIEDLIVAKLEWARLGHSARQIEDVRALVAIAGTELDRDHVRAWVEQLNLQQQWHMVDAGG